MATKAPTVRGTCPFCGKRMKLVNGGVLPRHLTSLRRKIPAYARPRYQTRPWPLVYCPDSGKPPAEQRRIA